MKPSVTRILRANYNAKIRELNRTLGKVNKYVAHITPEMTGYQIYQDLTKILNGGKK